MQPELAKPQSNVRFGEGVERLSSLQYRNPLRLAPEERIARAQGKFAAGKPGAGQQIKGSLTFAATVPVFGG